MIQSTLFFILGFLCAAFLVLVVAPAFWRRAVKLTRKRIEASMPLTLNEIHAEADSVRAEAAMTIRRLEINVKTLKEKVAEQLVEINRGREELRRLADENVERSRIFVAAVAKAPEPHAISPNREQEITVLTRKLGQADERIANGASELEQLGKMYEDLSFVSSSRQIELASAEEEIERLSTDMSRLRSQRKDVERRLEEIAAENEALKEALATERKRFADLEHETDRMRTLLNDGESRDREPARLPKPAGEDQQTASGRDLRLASQPSKTNPQTAMPDGPKPPQPPVTPGRDARDDRFAQLAAERDRLERQLTASVREIKALRDTDGAKSVEANGMEGDAILREQIHELAAEVVGLTASTEGPDSPIHKALAEPSDPHPASGPLDGAMTSLADRVRALRKAAEQS